jgi:hypothetical protein
MTSPHYILAEILRDQFKLIGIDIFAQILKIANIKITFKIPDEFGETDIIEKRIYKRLDSYFFIL